MNGKTPLPPSSATPLGSRRDWRSVFEAALVERDSSLLPRRLQDAKNAVMDSIEDSLDSASASERKLLLAALNTISELQRLAQVDEPPVDKSALSFPGAA